MTSNDRQQFFTPAPPACRLSRIPVIIECTAPTLICETLCAVCPNVAIPAAPLAHPGEAANVPVTVDPVTVQLPKLALNAPVPLLNVPVAPV